MSKYDSGGGEAVSRLYADFGDVRNDTFKEWWTQKDHPRGLDRGARLFGKESVDIVVQALRNSIKSLSVGKKSTKSADFFPRSLRVYTISLRYLRG